tara:strand:- start:94 stop:537 length:444 start_codon:yes stop_codon:yes gene_type:complete
METKQTTTTAEPMFQIHSSVGRSPTMEGFEFAVQIILMNKSLYIWVGTGDARSQSMNNLTAALTSRSTTYKKTTPSVATIFEGGVADDSSSFAEGLAQRICQRTGQVAFVSYNLPVTSTPDEALLMEVERVASELIKKVAHGDNETA